MKVKNQIKSKSIIITDESGNLHKLLESRVEMYINKVGMAREEAEKLVYGDNTTKEKLILQK